MIFNNNAQSPLSVNPHPSPWWAHPRYYRNVPINCVVFCLLLNFQVHSFTVVGTYVGASLFALLFDLLLKSSSWTLSQVVFITWPRYWVENYLHKINLQRDRRGLFYQHNSNPDRYASIIRFGLGFRLLWRNREMSIDLTLLLLSCVLVVVLLGKVKRLSNEWRRFNHYWPQGSLASLYYGAHNTIVSLFSSFLNFAVERRVYRTTRGPVTRSRDYSTYYTFNYPILINYRHDVSPTRIERQYQ